MKGRRHARKLIKREGGPEGGKSSHNEKRPETSPTSLWSRPRIQIPEAMCAAIRLNRKEGSRGQRVKKKEKAVTPQNDQKKPRKKDYIRGGRDRRLPRKKSKT